MSQIDSHLHTLCDLASYCCRVITAHKYPTNSNSLSEEQQPRWRAQIDRPFGEETACSLIRTIAELMRPPLLLLPLNAVDSYVWSRKFKSNPHGTHSGPCHLVVVNWLIRWQVRKKKLGNVCVIFHFKLIFFIGSINCERNIFTTTPIIIHQLVGPHKQTCGRFASKNAKWLHIGPFSFYSQCGTIRDIFSGAWEVINFFSASLWEAVKFFRLCRFFFRFR